MPTDADGAYIYLLSTFWADDYLSGFELGAASLTSEPHVDPLSASYYWDFRARASRGFIGVQSRLVAPHWGHLISNVPGNSVPHLLHLYFMHLPPYQLEIQGMKDIYLEVLFTVVCNVYIYLYQ